MKCPLCNTHITRVAEHLYQEHKYSQGQIIDLLFERSDKLERAVKKLHKSVGLMLHPIDTTLPAEDKKPPQVKPPQVTNQRGIKNEKVNHHRNHHNNPINHQPIPKTRNSL